MWSVHVLAPYFMGVKKKPLAPQECLSPLTTLGEIWVYIPTDLWPGSQIVQLTIYLY